MSSEEKKGPKSTLVFLSMRPSSPTEVTLDLSPLAGLSVCTCKGDVQSFPTEISLLLLPKAGLPGLK
jgi:hypothetical protein